MVIMIGTMTKLAMVIVVVMVIVLVNVVAMVMAVVMIMAIKMSGWIFEKVIDSYKPGVPSNPLPNFPVSSSSLDILDNRHPRK